jgi:hypothetical protein
MKLIWQTIHGDLCGALASEPENVLAHVWNHEGWRMSCIFETTDEERLTYGSAEAAQLNAQELMNAWVERHTLGWKDKSPDTLKREQRAELLEALEGVIRVADRDTVEFEAARAAVAKAKGGSAS